MISFANNPFTSAIELFTAIYLVYIIAEQNNENSFIGGLIQKILRSFNEEENNLELAKIDYKIKCESTNSLIKDIPSINSPSFEINKSNLEQLLFARDEAINSAEKDLKSKINYTYLNRSFKYISFFMVLYGFQLMISFNFFDIIFGSYSTYFLTNLALMTSFYLYVAWKYDMDGCNCDPIKFSIPKWICNIFKKLETVNGYVISMLNSSY